MQRILSTLYVTEYRSHVRAQKGNLVVIRPDGKARVPIESLDAVVLFGGQITTEAIDLCVRRAVRVAALRRSGRVRFTISGPPAGNVYLRVAQLRAADDANAALDLARMFVAGKLQSYRTLLARWGVEARGPERTVMVVAREVIAERISALPSAMDGDVVRGLEGDATRRYFKGLRAHLAGRTDVGSFITRNRRPPRDPVNALLSFLYGVTQAEVDGALDSIGLDRQVGFLHGLRPGRSALALDVLEEFRPLADRLAVRLLTRRQLRLEHFVRTEGGATYLSDDGRTAVLSAIETWRGQEVEHRLLGRSVPIWALPSIQATLLARRLRGDLPAYPPFVLAG